MGTPNLDGHRSESYPRAWLPRPLLPTCIAYAACTTPASAPRLHEPRHLLQGQDRTWPCVSTCDSSFASLHWAAPGPRMCASAPATRCASPITSTDATRLGPRQGSLRPALCAAAPLTSARLWKRFRRVASPTAGAPQWRRRARPTSPSSQAPQVAPQVTAGRRPTAAVTTYGHVQRMGMASVGGMAAAAGRSTALSATAARARRASPGQATWTSSVE